MSTKWKLVPVDPTQQQLAAACKAALSTEVLFDDTRFACDRAGYVAALAAAPEPPVTVEALLGLVRDILPELAHESEQRATSGDDEDRENLEALIKRIGDVLETAKEVA